MNQFDQYPFLNPTTLAMLKKSTASNPALLADLFRSFIDDSEELLSELDKSTEERDFDAFYTAIHTLKGLCGTIGCTRMFEVLKIMDGLNKEKDFENSNNYLVQLKTVFAETSEAINTEVFIPVEQNNNENP